MKLRNPETYFFKLPKKKIKDNISIPEVWYPNIRSTWNRCTTKRLYNPIFGIKAIVIHATAGYASSHVISNMANGKSSFHWLIPDEDEKEHGNLVWACTPETLAAWHVRNKVRHPKVNQNKNKTNHWSLGIEIVNTQKKDDPFSDWQIGITSNIVRYCWAKYPNLEYIVSHAMLDPKRRSDPGINFDWEKFKELVLHKGYNEKTIFDKYVNSNTIDSSLDGNLCC